MKTRAPDPLRLEVAAIANAGAELSGQWPAEALPRWTSSQTAPQDTALPPVAWRVRGERRPVPGAEPEIWLHLKADAHQWLICQRCLQPFDEAVVVDRRIRFVRSESEAEALDADLEDDVLALNRPLNLRELVEDELLLALPLVPRHGVCPQPLLPASTVTEPVEPAADGIAGAVEDGDPPPHPFAALQALKRR